MLAIVFAQNRVGDQSVTLRARTPQRHVHRCFDGRRAHVTRCSRYAEARCDESTKTALDRRFSRAEDLSDAMRVSDIYSMRSVGVFGAPAPCFRLHDRGPGFLWSTDRHLLFGNDLAGLLWAVAQLGEPAARQLERAVVSDLKYRAFTSLSRPMPQTNLATSN